MSNPEFWLRPKFGIAFFEHIPSTDFHKFYLIFTDLAFWAKGR